MTEDLARIFSAIHGRYELANHIVTCCMDVSWRRSMMTRAEEAKNGNWLDLCCGTGETTRRLNEAARGRSRVVGTDFTLSMLRDARGKDRNSGVDFILSDAKVLPFRDDTFALVTISFATRNLASFGEGLGGVLEEILRILKPGGCLINLDTSQPPNEVLRGLARLYTAKVVRPLHGLVTGSAEGAGYLSETVLGFHDAEGLKAILSRAGFTDISFHRLFFGASAVHVSRKPGGSAR